MTIDSDNQSLSLGSDSDYTLSVESLDLAIDEEGNPTEQLLTRLEEGQYFGQVSFLDPEK